LSILILESQKLSKSIGRWLERAAVPDLVERNVAIGQLVRRNTEHPRCDAGPESQPDEGCPWFNCLQDGSCHRTNGDRRSVAKPDDIGASVGKDALLVPRSVAFDFKRPRADEELRNGRWRRVLSIDHAIRFSQSTV